MTDTEIPESGRAAPRFDEPLAMLAACHERIEEQLRALERLVPHLAECGCDERARTAARAVIQYFDTAGKDHQIDEEEHLFPFVRSLAATRRHPVVGATLYELQREHATIDKLYAGLRRQLEDIGEGRASRLDAGQVERFAWIHRRHMALEAEVVLPFASATLDQAQRRALGAAMAERRSATTQ